MGLHPENLGHRDRYAKLEPSPVILSSVNAVAIAPDGKRAISASWDYTLKIWDTETGTELKTLTGHTSWVNAVAIAPDDLTAISASWDKTLKIWEHRDRYANLKPSPVILTG